MKRKKEAAVAVPAKQEARDETPARTEDNGRIIERADGFYWLSLKGEAQSGPFTTRAEAELDLQSGGGELEIGDLQEAESEIGISEWIDPDTGGPAEDSVPRLEDH